MSFFRDILHHKSEKEKKNNKFYNRLQEILGFNPKKLNVYQTAFTHRSLNLKNKTGNPVNYERLEFLGDATLSTVIAHYLFLEAPSGDEGYLTKMRSKIVSRQHLNELGKELQLLELVNSKIPKNQFGNNIHGNLFEALIGAIFLDRGYKYCEKFIYNRIINPHVDIEKLEGKVISYKSLLIEWCQKEKKTFNYEVYDDTGNDAIKHFAVKLAVNNKVVAKARATSKKKAEEKASKRAFFVFQEQISNNF